MTRLIGKTEEQNEAEMKRSDRSCLRGRHTFWVFLRTFDEGFFYKANEEGC